MRRAFAIFLLPLFVAGAARANEGLPADDGELTARLQQLEVETQALRDEVRRLREQPVRLPQVESFPPQAEAALPNFEATSSGAGGVGGGSAGYIVDQPNNEAKRLAWTKGEFSIVPYGILWFNMNYETHRTNDGDFAYYVFSPSDPRDGRSDYNINARATRLGLDLAGPDIPLFANATSGGKVEIDFFGASVNTENRAGVLLRHAYIEVKNEQFRLLAGQTFDVISPLWPGTLLYTVGWGAGNIGYRRAQFRGERYTALSDTLLVTATGALAVDLVSEFGPPILAGDHASWPTLQGRLGATLGPRGEGCWPVDVGVSAHVGQQRFVIAGPRSEGEPITWSLNADFRYPLTPRLGVQGELFTGENLGTYLGGILQGINVATGEPIRSSGGWMEVWYDWTPRTHTHVGYGIDDPLNRDITNGRTYNEFLFANISYDLTKKFLVGLEFTDWNTLYDAQADAHSDRFEFVAKYGF